MSERQQDADGHEAARLEPTHKPLLDAIRQSGLTGTKEGCGEGECGACGVLLDGVLVNSCLTPLAHAEGAAITTIEGVATDATLHSIQESFLEHGGAQCGICTPGMVLAAVSLLEHTPRPTDAEIRAHPGRHSAADTATACARSGSDASPKCSAAG